MFAQRWAHFENCSYLCQESRLNFVTIWLFTSIIQYTNTIVGLKLLTTGANVTTVLRVQRKKSYLV